MINPVFFSRGAGKWMLITNFSGYVILIFRQFSFLDFQMYHEEIAKVWVG